MLFILKHITQKVLGIIIVSFLIASVLVYEIYICYNFYYEYLKLSNINLQPNQHLINVQKYEIYHYDFLTIFNEFEQLQITLFYNYSNRLLFTEVETALILSNISAYLLILHKILLYKLDNEFLSQYSSAFSVYSIELETRPLRAFSNSQLIYLGKWMQFSLGLIEDNVTNAGIVLDDYFKTFQNNFQKLGKFTIKSTEENNLTTVCDSRV